jgi:hypothetical protein
LNGELFLDAQAARLGGERVGHRGRLGRAYDRSAIDEATCPLRSSPLLVTVT